VGYSTVTTVLSPAASRSLTDLPTVKTELSIDSGDTTDDAWLAQAIFQVSGSIERYTKRALVPEYVVDNFDIEQDAYPWQTPGGFAQLQLSRWPVLAVTSVVQTLATGVTQVLSAGTDFRLNPATGQLLRLNRFTGVGVTWEAIPVAVTYSAGYGVLIEETGAVPQSAPYQVTVQGAGAFSCDQSVSYAGGAPLARVSSNPAQGQYSVTAGVYTFNIADAGQALAFAYATVNIPPGLVEICLTLITGRFIAKGRDPALVQRDTPGVGTERWWVGGTPGQTGAFPPDIAAALDDYRVPTVA